MSVLYVLSPSLPAATEPALRRWLARGDRLPDVEDPRVAVVRGLFRFAGKSTPVAALRHHVHGDDASAGSWVCADPVHVRGEAAGARLMAWPLRDVSGEEARELSTALMPLFGDAGMPLTVDAPATWCLHVAGGAPDVVFTQPADALGTDLLACLPRGDAGRRWRHLFNEAQVALHVHPVNAARIAAGKLPVNALWFWGAGALPPSAETALSVVASSDDVIGGLAKLARVPCERLAPEAVEASSVRGDVLLDLDTNEPAGISAQWFACFRHGLRRGRFDAVELAFPTGQRLRVRHAHRLRFWRHG